METLTLFGPAACTTCPALGVWAPTLALYLHGHDQSVTVAVSTIGGGAQSSIGPEEARQLAKALTDWADSVPGEAD